MYLWCVGLKPFSAVKSIVVKCILFKCKDGKENLGRVRDTLYSNVSQKTFYRNVTIKSVSHSAQVFLTIFTLICLTATQYTVRIPLSLIFGL